MKKLFSVVGSLAVIIACALLGSITATTFIKLLNWQGGLATFTTLLLSMFLAFLFFTVGIMIRNLIYPAPKGD